MMQHRPVSMVAGAPSEYTRFGLNDVMKQSVQGRRTPNISLLWIIPGPASVAAGIVNGPCRTVFVFVAACVGAANA